MDKLIENFVGVTNAMYMNTFTKEIEESLYFWTIALYCWTISGSVPISIKIKSPLKLEKISRDCSKWKGNACPSMSHQKVKQGEKIGRLCINTALPEEPSTSSTCAVWTHGAKIDLEKGKCQRRDFTYRRTREKSLCGNRWSRAFTY